MAGWGPLYAQLVLLLLYDGTVEGYLLVLTAAWW